MEIGFGKMVVSVFNIVVMGGIALAIFMVVFQGINLLNSRGNASAFSKAKEKIKNILIGLAILLFSYVILITINPDLVDVKLDLRELILNPIILPGEKPPVEKLDKYIFDEIPLGTIVEELLAGVSSVETPCYQYETNFKDASGNIIIGNVIDQNKDGIIDDKDIILNVDLFSCISPLTSAYAAKVEYHIKPLINQLNILLKSSCSCSNLYVGRLEGQGIFSRKCDNFVYEDRVLMPYNSGRYYPLSCPGDFCSPCITPYSFCTQICGGEYGCPEAQPSYYGPVTNPFKEVNGIKQYEYDTCTNRLEITCKTEEIQQIITGEKPSQICYDNGYITETGIESPILLTLNDAVERIKYFKDYFQERVVQLSCAKEKMKEPWGERITLAEYEKLKSEITGYKVEKATFENYDISRYCGEFNSLEEAMADNEPCKMVDGERQYFYDGDAATFYFNEDYNNYKNYTTRDQEQQKCTVVEGDIDLGNYAGVIPIGEVVDEAQEWGKVIASAIDNILLDSRGIVENIVTISGMLSTCSADRCMTTNSLYGETTCSGRCRGAVCSCPHIMAYPCGYGIPSSMVPDKYYTRTVACYGIGWCSSCKEDRAHSFYSCKRFPPILPSGCLCGTRQYPVPRPQYWVCDYESFCDSVKKIYWNNDEIGKDNFVSTDDAAEKAKRDANLSKIGYLQRFKGYAEAFNDLSKMGIDSPKYKVPFLDIIKEICGECDLIGPPTTSIFEPSSPYDYSCSYSYVPKEIKVVHTNCPYIYNGPVGMYWCEKQGEYWSCPIIPDQCDGPPPYIPPEKVDDPVAPPNDDIDPANDPEYAGEEIEVWDCPYEYIGLEDEFYWCEKQGEYWSCPIREEDKDDCLIEEVEDFSCPTDPSYVSGGEIYWCERQGEYWSCPVDKKDCSVLFCPPGEEATGVYYCPADDNYWCIEPSAYCFEDPEEKMNCPYDYDGPAVMYWCEKQGEYWSCPIREEDEYLCFDDEIASINDSCLFENCDGTLIAKKESNLFLRIFDDVKNFVSSFFAEKTKDIAENSGKYLSEHLGIESAFGQGRGLIRRRRPPKCSLRLEQPACCVTVSTSQSFTSPDSSKNIGVENRFDILEKLEYSRKKLTGCVKGYGAGYKDNPTEVVEVLSCIEGIIDRSLLILPTFPYPSASNASPPYNNCYPLNSDKLTDQEKTQCFNNPLREGIKSNPGCLLITKDYMYNYYCCN